MTPTPSPAAVYRISEKEPVFPCWLEHAETGWRHYEKGTLVGFNREDYIAMGYIRWSDAPEAPKEAPDDGWEARDQEANGYPVPTPTPLSSAEGTPLTDAVFKKWENKNDVGYLGKELAELARSLERQLTAARQEARGNAQLASDINASQQSWIEKCSGMIGELEQARRESEGLRAENKRLMDQTSAGYVFNQMKRAWKALGEEEHEYRPHKLAEAITTLRASTTELQRLLGIMTNERNGALAELEKAKEERETDNKERNAHIASLQSALGKAEEDKARLDWLEAISPEANIYIRKVIGQREESLYGWRTSRLRELIDSARSARRTPGEGKGE